MEIELQTALTASSQCLTSTPFVSVAKRSRRSELVFRQLWVSEGKEMAWTRELRVSGRRRREKNREGIVVVGIKVEEMKICLKNSDVV